MARTFIGELILRLKDEASGQAKGSADRITGSMDAIQRAASRLNSAPWGGRFQAQVDKMGASARELDTLRNSWERLQAAFKDKNISGALRGAEIGRWQLGALSHLREVAAAAKDAEGHAGRLRDRLNELKRIGLHAAGYGSGIYLGGVGAREAMTAASEQARTHYRLQQANVPAGEIDKMQREAERLSSKYGVIDQTAVLELNKTAYSLMGGNGDRARALMEPMVKAFVADVVAVGVDKAGENLSSFLKAMDNLNVNEGPDGGVDNIGSILEGWVKSKQVEGKDIDIGAILGFARRAKIAKYALSDDFLRNVLPSLGQDSGFDATGDSLAGAYQNLVTPSGTGKQAQYVKQQKKFGLRDKNNSLIERDLFASDPFEWTTSVLKPLLEKNGVDTNNDAATAEAIKKLMSNNKAAAMVSGWIAAEDQIRKNIRLNQEAAGFADAENSRYKDPFSALESFYSSLRNFSSAVLPMETAAAGLNTLANSVNRLQQAIRDGGPMATAGVTAGVAMGGFATWKLLGAIWGLATAGPALNAAALSLEAAAVSLAAGSKVGAAGTVAAGAATTTAGGGALAAVASSPTFWGAVAALAAVVGLGLLGRDATEESKKPPYRYYPQGPEQDRDNWQRQFGQVAFEGGRHRVGLGAGPAPSDSIQAAVDQAENAGSQIQQALSVTATPAVNTSALQEAVRLAQQFLSVMRAAASVAANAADNVPRTGSTSVSRQMNRNFTDHGVHP